MSNRRFFITRAIVGPTVGFGLTSLSFGNSAGHPDRRWYDVAAQMLERARSWNDQPYGAVLVAGGAVIGEGPSRVVRDGNPDAHAERVAIADAQRRLGRTDLAGSVLYSTSRPCAACEAAAYRAGVSRMYVGAALDDAGRPGVAGRWSR
ncbi:deaminase [Piscinibacter sakaiensis]|uniref:deaminase n=1 Tax=Piscinibacter sakaiensis TaxID=1547922 RepID=UPI003AAF774B